VDIYKYLVTAFCFKDNGVKLYGNSVLRLKCRGVLAYLLFCWGKSWLLELLNKDLSRSYESSDKVQRVVGLLIV
jgi:hypothetical protein